MERKMASIREVKAVRDIPNADKIQAYVVDGWTVVGQKGDYSVGDHVVYCEIDSWIPHTLAPFLSKGKEPRNYNGVLGERLRTIKLRGQISQGLLLSKEVLSDREYKLGEDVSVELGITKYEPPLPVIMSGNAKGVFPSFLIKTDQERIQNLFAEDLYDVYEVSEKLDGTSATYFLKDGEFGVCSRNLELSESENNVYWQVAKRENIEAKMRSVNLSDFAIQGEIVGHGIQGNKYGISTPTLYVFNVFHIPSGRYLAPLAARAVVESMKLKYVPLLSDMHIFKENHRIEDFLEAHDGMKSLLVTDTLAEGVVYKSLTNTNKSFKVISNEWLLRNG